jgi:succinate dehydrogenase/fumarate reductase cytochrome b subunit
MIVSETAEGTSRYGNLLPTLLSVCQSLSGGLTLVLTFMCVLIFFCFLLITVKGLEPF